MNNILITGITGFIGGNLKGYLKNQYNIFGISRKTNNRENIISYKELTVNHFNSSEVFIHLAGKAHDLKKVATENLYFEVNTDLTTSLFDKWLQSDCSVFIFLSSVKAVADKADGVLSEDEVPNPQTVYGISKLKAEQYILEKDLPKNKKVYILRPCMIHGPNNKGNLNLLYNFVKMGLPIPLGRFKNKRSFLSVDNLCFIIKEIIEKKPKSGIYNVSDNEMFSTNQLILLIGEVIVKKPLIFNMPKWTIKYIAKVGDVFPIPINSDRLNKLTEHYCVSNNKIMSTLKTSLPLTGEEGFIKTINSFKN